MPGVVGTATPWTLWPTRVPQPTPTTDPQIVRAVSAGDTPVPPFVAGTATSSTGGTTATLVVPAGVSTTDLGIIVVNTADNTSRVPSIPGWTVRVADPAGQANSAFYVLTRLGGQVAGDTITATLSGGNAAVRMTGAWYSTTGQDVSVVGTPGTRNATSSAALVIPGVTPTVNGSLIIAIASERTTATGTLINSWTPSAPIQDLFSEDPGGSTVNAVSQFVGHFTQTTAAATGDYTATYNSGSTNGAGVLLVVPPLVPPWVRRTLIQAPRNGTTSHTVNFVAADAGNLLVLVMEGAVTHTVPTGWTRQAQALNSTELSVYTKTATAGESSFSTTHNGSNYPIGAVVYEFYSGSTFVSAVSSTGLAPNASNPTLSGLTGTNAVFGATGYVPSSGGPGSVAWTAPTGITEDTDVAVPTSGTDGYELSTAYIGSYTGASFTPASTAEFVNGSREALTFAIKVASAPVVAPSVYLLRDTFTRTNATSAGVADTGQAWNQNVGDWGTDGSTLGSATQADGNWISVDVGTRVQDFSAKLAAGGTNAYPGWMINWETSNRYYRAEVAPDGVITLTRNVSNAFTDFGTSAAGAMAVGKVLRLKSEISTSSTLLTVFVDDVQVLQATDTWAASGRPEPTGTRVGFRHGAGANGASIRWDDAIVNRTTLNTTRFFLFF